MKYGMGYLHSQLFIEFHFGMRETIKDKKENLVFSFCFMQNTGLQSAVRH